MMQTNEGAFQYEHTLDHFVEYFFKAGSVFDSPKRRSFYRGEESALSLFEKIWIVDKEFSFKLLLWLRDCRGGAGNRSAFRSCLKWVASTNPEWVIANIDSIPEVGRWDDLTVLFGTPVQRVAADLWAQALKNNNVLAAKWCKRDYVPVRNAFGMSKEVDFRKLLSRIRSQHIVETKMSAKTYDQIEYSDVPSLAMARYTNAFKRHDEVRFSAFKRKVETGEVKINAEVLFPHDCVRTALNGDTEIADLQFSNLPNYFEGTNEKVIVLCDTSGSMGVCVSGSIQAVHISTGLALYCSDKIGKQNPFYRKFIGFESESKFKNWEDMTFSQALHNEAIFDGAVGATRIDTALNLILETGLFFNLSKDQMPTALVIVSDMQFSAGVKNASSYERKTLPKLPRIPIKKSANKWVDEEYDAYDVYDDTDIDDAFLPKLTPAFAEIFRKWAVSGYDIPKIIYWNTAGYVGAPDIADSKNVALVSGFSPAILKAVFNGSNFDPRSILRYSLEKYKVNIPT